MDVAIGAADNAGFIQATRAALQEVQDHFAKMGEVSNHHAICIESHHSSLFNADRAAGYLRHKVALCSDDIDKEKHNMVPIVRITPFDATILTGKPSCKYRILLL